MQDAVPKALMHFMVNAVQRGLQQHLIRKLYREELFEAIMEERQDIAAKRTQCQEVRRLSGVEGSGLGSTQAGRQGGEPSLACVGCWAERAAVDSVCSV
jgi:hypothetical protein